MTRLLRRRCLTGLTAYRRAAPRRNRDSRMRAIARTGSRITARGGAPRSVAVRGAAAAVSVRAAFDKPDEGRTRRRQARQTRTVLL